MANKTFSSLIKDRVDYEIINRGGDSVAEDIYKTVPKTESTADKAIFCGLTILGGFALSSFLKDDDGHLSRSDKRMISAIGRGLIRRAIR